MNAANKYLIHDIDIEVFDDDQSITTVFIAKEIRENHYGIQNMKYKDGDVIIDLGANVGLWSIYTAITNSTVQIYSIEGLDVSYQNLSDNIVFNKLTNCTAFQFTATATPKLVQIACPDRMTAAASILYGAKPDVSQFSHHNLCEGVKIDDIWDRLGVKHCRLMKVNLEGGEYEAFFACTTWSRIGFLSIEIHEMPNEAKDLDYTQDRLEAFIAKNMPHKNYHIVRVPYDPNPTAL